jgi:hypothetical protein
MKRLLMLFTMLFCFSIAGICKTTVTDLSENSKMGKELVSYSDVVKQDVAFAASFEKAILSDAFVLEVPTLQGKQYIITKVSNLTKSDYKHKDIAICIRDKIRII